MALCLEAAMQSLPRNISATAFSAGLLKPSVATPDGVIGPNGKAADKRYNVYRNNVTVSLINAMTDIYPAILRITGEEFFRALAREYVRQHPPKSPLLFLFGEHFADFLTGFDHAKHLPYLADVARLERAWLTAYHAADAKPLDPAILSSVSPEQTGQLTFKAKPGTYIISSEFPVFTIYAMNRDLMPLDTVDMSTGEAALVTRPDADVVVTPITSAETAFFDALLVDGLNLAHAAGTALEIDADFNINEALSKLFGTGAATSAKVS